MMVGPSRSVAALAAVLVWSASCPAFASHARLRAGHGEASLARSPELPDGEGTTPKPDEVAQAASPVWIPNMAWDPAHKEGEKQADKAKDASDKQEMPKAEKVEVPQVPEEVSLDKDAEKAEKAEKKDVEKAEKEVEKAEKKQPCTTPLPPCKHYHQVQPKRKVKGPLYSTGHSLQEYKVCGAVLNEAWDKERHHKCSHLALEAADQMREHVCRCARHPRWGKSYVMSYRELLDQQATWCGNTTGEPKECHDELWKVEQEVANFTGDETKNYHLRHEIVNATKNYHEDPCAKVNTSDCEQLAEPVILWVNRDKNQGEGDTCHCDQEVVSNLKAMDLQAECCDGVEIESVEQDIGYLKVGRSYSQVYDAGVDTVKKDCPNIKVL